MRSIDDLQDAFSALEADPPDADEVLAALRTAGGPRLPRAVRAWGVPAAVAFVAAAAVAVPVVALHDYDQGGNAVSPATAAPSTSASPPVAVGTQFTQALPVPVGNTGLNYGFMIDPITGCTSWVASITRRYQEQIVACGAAGTKGSVGTTASVFLFYKGAFTPPVLGPNPPVTFNGEPAYQMKMPSPDDGSMVTALVWQYAPDGYAMVAEPAPASVRAEEVAHCLAVAAQSAAAAADRATPESAAPTALASADSTTPASAAPTTPANCVAADVSATAIAEAVRPASIPVNVPLRLDLPGLYVHDLESDTEVGVLPTGAVGFSAQPETAAGAAQSSGDTWNFQYGIGGGPFPDVDTTGAIVNFVAAGHQWTIYHDHNEAATVLVLNNAGQLLLIVTPGKGRSVSDADLTTLAAKITLPPTPSDPSTWFDISTVLP